MKTSRSNGDLQRWAKQRLS